MYLYSPAASALINSVLGAKIAPGSDAGAYLVPHVQGAADEMRYLAALLGADADALLARGAAEIRRRFKPNAL